MRYVLSIAIFIILSSCNFCEVDKGCTGGKGGPHSITVKPQYNVEEIDPITAHIKYNALMENYHSPGFDDMAQLSQINNTFNFTGLSCGNYLIKITSLHSVTGDTLIKHAGVTVEQHELNSEFFVSL